MSLADYRTSLGISKRSPSFGALLFAMFRVAGQVESGILREFFPREYAEMWQRHRAKETGGWIDGDPPAERPFPVMEMFREDAGRKRR